MKKIDASIASKVEDLLCKMTLAEKVGQLILENAFLPINWHDVLQKQKLADERGEAFTVEVELDPVALEHIRVGRVTAINCNDPKLNNQLQKIAVEESRLHIPLLIGHDVIHGFMTIFPIPLAESCSWNPELLERSSYAAAVEAACMGINWIFAPMVDIARDPRWGRIAEGAGEDVYLGAIMAQARVRGFQSNGLPQGRRIAACLKHYVGYGGAEAGRDYNTVDMSERTLRDVYLPPFKAAFDENAGSTMCAFNEISGVPGTSNSFLLRTVLRNEWDWHGPVVSDFNSIGELVQHGVAQDLRDAARLGILGGVDIDMDSHAYSKYLTELVEAGDVAVEILDESVRRVLYLKFSLGLFENPYVDETLHETYILSDEHRALALDVAHESMVLLKNDADCLPLSTQGKRIALIGPLANNRADLLGAWAITGQASDVDTVLYGLEQYLPSDSIRYVQGCQVTGDDHVDIASAVAAADESDIIVLVVGESAGMSGEAHSRVYLGLPGRQQELADALVATGKPLVTVLMCGRPLVVPKLVEQSSALLVAWHGGIRAGQAVANILLGMYNPSGKLTTSWPRAEGQIPVYYAHKSTGRPAEGKGTLQFHEPFRSTYLDIPNAPLFAFGEGKSYTQFEYRDLRVLTPSVPMNGTVQVDVLIKNTGSCTGVEIVQLYVRDLVGSVTRPVKELKGFQRVSLKAGEEQRVRFDVPVNTLGFHGLDNKYRIESGMYNVWIGPDSATGLDAGFEISL